MADFQFGKGCGDVFFPEGVSFRLSKTKRVRQVFNEGEHIATVRAKDGMLTLGMEGARTLHEYFSSPARRVVVCEDAVPFVAKGKTAFAKHVLAIDPELRAGDEVVVVSESDELLATGQLIFSPFEIGSLDKGAAVDVRRGKDQS
ncbi:pseudouridine synthase [Methanolobus halotolerans]|uniref:Pseudouridine synthase n=2 Tax=Methanolobus halotolerans TaxID=2052935 RepID=A0A4E0Q7E8_9EURY|nr:pseudouridine synthase [Methanolobus halotolerans]